MYVLCLEILNVLKAGMLQLLEELHKKIQREMNAVQLTVISRKYTLTSFFRAVLKVKS